LSFDLGVVIPVPVLPGVEGEYAEGRGVEKGVVVELNREERKGERET
jgi:hypothetical protein